MKFSLFALVTAVASADSASRPTLSLALSGEGPTLGWSDSSTLMGDVEFDYSIEANARPTTDLASIPKTIFGTLRKRIGGWGVSAGATRDMKIGSTGIEVRAGNEDAGILVKVLGTAEGGLKSVSATKDFFSEDASLSITPTYSLADGESDILVNFDKGNTSVELTASMGSQEVDIHQTMGDTTARMVVSRDAQEIVLGHSITKDTSVRLSAFAKQNEDESYMEEISNEDGDEEETDSDDDVPDDEAISHTADNDNGISAKSWGQDVLAEVAVLHQINGQNTISPSINSEGDISVTWERSLGERQSLTTTLNVNDSVDVECKGDQWIASLSAGVSGFSLEGLSVYARRDITFGEDTDLEFEQEDDHDHDDNESHDDDELDELLSTIGPEFD